MNEFNEMIEEMKENAWTRFDWNVANIACAVLDRLDEEEMEEDKCEAILSAMNDELIYTSDQWALIQYYMNPEEIGTGKTLSDVMMDFFEDLMRL